MSSASSERKQIESAIAALEAQRDTLGDVAVDAALEGLHQKLGILEDAREMRQGELSLNKRSSERRIVTVLFCDVTGSTALAEKLDPEEWTGIMNTAFEMLNQPVQRFGGTVARLMGDAVLAFFGAPVAHEDDPQRAVLAGLGILENIAPFREKLREERGLDFNVRVGINTGLVVVGEVGSEIYGEYTAMGDAVNLAARMEQTAQPGTVQISESTYKLVAPLFECQSLGGIVVKGKTESIQAYRVLARKAVPGKVRGLTSQGVSSPLVGREVEFGAARDAVSRLQNGEGGILSIIGEAGIGKSRLVAELNQASYAGDRSPVTWLEGRTLSFGQTISYWPFQEILWSYSGITEEDSEVQAWTRLEEKISALFPENTAEVLPYLASLLALEVRGEYAERVKYLDGGAIGDQILLTSRRFFKRLAQDRPLVLVFEDLHWVDESSARLLEWLLPLVEMVPLLIIGLSRPDPDTPAARLRQIAVQDTAARYTEVNLAPLSQSDSVQLVHNLLEIDGLPAQVRELIVRKADGNPFFLEEIIRDLIERGGVVRDRGTGRWRATQNLTSIAIPDSIHAVIVARVDRLDEDLKRVLRTASVIGRSFLHRVLDVVLETDNELDNQLEELQTIELIREKQRLPELEYIFKHALAQEATYEGILLQIRRELHARVGQAIEILFPDRIEEFYGLLAYHYAMAEDWEKAQEYLLKAGDLAIEMAAGAEALIHYRRAIEANDQIFGNRWDPVQRASLARKMGIAYYALGQLLKCQYQLSQALSIFDKPYPLTKLGLISGLLGQIILQFLHRVWPSRFLNQASTSQREISLEAGSAYDRLGEVFYVVGDPFNATYAWLRALNLAEFAGPSSELAWAYATNSLVASQTPGLRSIAELFGQYANELAEREKDIFTLAWVSLVDGARNINLGNWPEVIKNTGRGADMSKRIGHLRWLEENWGTMATAYYLHGEFKRSKKTWQDVYVSARERGDRQPWVWSCCGQTSNRLRMGYPGHIDESFALMKEAERLLSEYQHPVRPDQIRVYSLLAQVQFRKGDVASAQQAAEKAEGLITSELLPSTFYGLEGYTGVPLIYLSLWETQTKRGSNLGEEKSFQKLARQGCKGLQGYARLFLFARPRAWLYQGWYEWLAGKSRKAQKTWRKSLAHAEKLDMPYEQGLAHYEIGRHLATDDPGRGEHLRQAVAIFSRLEAAWDLERAQKDLQMASP